MTGILIWQCEDIGRSYDNIEIGVVQLQAKGYQDDTGS